MKRAASIWRCCEEVQPDIDNATELNHPSAQLESVYTQMRGISGTPLRDSFHLGQTIINDYGRPYEGGFNNYSGFSARAEAGRFTLYYRGEYQYAPSATGYSPTLYTFLSCDGGLYRLTRRGSARQRRIRQRFLEDRSQRRTMRGCWRGISRITCWDTRFRLARAITGWGRTRARRMLWSNNEQDIYHFQIDRVEPLRIPGLSRVTGPFRYEFFIGSLKGHTSPNDPWVHVEKISMKPTKDLEFGFSRMVLWGGKGFEPITLHTFLKSFFSVTSGANETGTRNDPGARFSSFDFDWRLPRLQKWLTLYADSFAHDEVNPHRCAAESRVPRGTLSVAGSRSAASRSAGRRGQHGTGKPQHSQRPYAPINLGQFFYYQVVQRQGPTNEGFLPDWVGREGKGGQGG